MNLFEKVPDNFFSILSSKNKEVYVDALMLLHRQFQYVLNIETSEYIAALAGLLDDRNYELEEDDEPVEGGLTLTAKARLILSRFVKTGWVDRENMDGSFTEVITPRDYAIQVMKLIHDLSNTQIHEYNSLVFSAYSALKEAQGEEHSNQMYEALINAKSNTEKLTYEMRTLYHGIRKFLRKIQGQNDINALLHDHFEEYKTMADRIYHPIKTMDSVFRYKAPIMEILTNVLGDQDLLDSMRKRAMSIRKYENEEEAGLEIITAINYVLDKYRTIDGIINEIDKKNSAYTKLSIDTIRYHITADQTISGKLVEVLKRYSAASGKKQEQILKLMEKTVCANRQDFFDGQSLWHRNVKHRRLSLEPLSVASDARLSQTETDSILTNLNNAYSLSHIQEYIDKLFGGRSSISTKEIDIPDNNEFILLLLAAIRAGERNTDFKAEVGSNGHKINGYNVPEIVFTRKKGGNKHAE